MSKQSTQWLIPLGLAVAATAALGYYWFQVSRPEPVAPPQPTQPLVSSEPEVVPGPLHPVATMETERAERPELVPLPALDQSDEYFKLGLSDVFGDAIGTMLVESGMIEKVVATVDNLPRQQVAEKIRPIGKLPEQFKVESQDDNNNTYTISAENYARYDPMVNLVVAADTQEMVALYRRFYPLFQSAYQDLGYPGGYFNDRLVEVIDHLLTSPQPQEPVTLVQPHVLFEYADESLESLSSGQIMLLRMGNDNAEEMKSVLRRLRTLVTDLEQ